MNKHHFLLQIDLQSSSEIFSRSFSSSRAIIFILSKIAQNVKHKLGVQGHM